MKLNLLNNLKDFELAKEKLDDFKGVIVVQVCLIGAAMIVREVLHLVQVPEWDKISEILFFGILGFYTWRMWDMLRNYTRNRWLLIGLLVLIMGTYFEGLVVVNPFFPLVTGTPFRIVTFIIMLTLMIVEVSVIYFTVIEMFRREHMTVEERLFGAACIYLIIGIAFGSAYEMVCIIDYTSIPMGVALGSQHFMNSIAYSILVMGGVDNPYPGSHALIQNLSAIESVIGNLFIVFVVGRLLYK
jgi:hypothetical protein